MAGKARCVTRVMESFMNQIHVERGRALEPREQKSLIERQHIEREEPERDQTRENPFLTESSDGRFHKCLRLSCSAVDAFSPVL